MMGSITHTRALGGLLRNVAEREKGSCSFAETLTRDLVWRVLLALTEETGLPTTPAARTSEEVVLAVARRVAGQKNLAEGDA